MAHEQDWSDKNTFYVTVDGNEYRYVAEYQEQPPEDPEDGRGMDKIFHYVIDPAGKKHMLDWTPYSKPTEEEVAAWIKLGMPKRFGKGPLDSEQLSKAASSVNESEEEPEKEPLSESYVARLKHLAGIS